MARIRSIKPEFFQHEGIFEAEIECKLPLRIAYAGLWTQCDREGRFEWRPRQLKLNVLPYDTCDFSAVLSSLEANGFITRYVVEGKSFGFIPSWFEHQYVNAREPSSTIPAPDEDSIGLGQVPSEASTGTRPVRALREGKVKGKGREREDARATARSTPGLDLQAFDRWESYRDSELRKPLGDMSVIAAAVALAKYGANQAAVVEQSIANKWQGLFDLKVTNGSGAHKSSTVKAKTIAELEAEEAARVQH